MFKTLYKKDSKGAVRQWSVRTDGDTVIVEHGQVGGSLVRQVTPCTPKNVGRANATTAEQQALAEAQAKWTKQVERERYTTDSSGVVEDSYLAPMLARDYTKVGHQLDWSGGVYVSRKVDGSRCLYDVAKDTLWSRKGTPITAPSHILEQVRSLGLKYGNLDGELYIHGQPLNRIMSATKKKNELTKQLEFVLFDFAVADMPFSTRLAHLEELDLSDTPNLSVLPTQLSDKADIKAHHDQFVQEGYEGLILREANSHYAFGQRAKGLMKYKEFREDDFLIIDVKEGLGGQGVLECVTSGGVTFGARSRGEDSYRVWQLENKEKVIGLMATVRYFDVTEYGTPQFPVCVAIGDEK
jgi:ATP-dependent DNA ligase